ncbi:zf-HC2 domain-containing protein [Duganella sp. FT3S]|uniref:Zf-HC2 domain-containing protein n=1 Tax=Rugamonas fusca TaxID=2758568 RepID=A0A7W2EE19_9BURK|nr:zf-HC2 domain-containing protein [Rugamonas fusca]MBA5604208.1 zf-HC2 domain-containing protein [Rugamonas fusca]
MLNCREITTLYSESMERKLTLAEQISVRMHVMMCSGCRNFGKQMQTLRHVARAYAKGEHEQDGESSD